MIETEEKQGIGGPDCLLFTYKRKSETYGVFTVFSPCKGRVGLQFEGQDAIIFSKEEFTSIVDWLKSWDYI